MTHIVRFKVDLQCAHCDSINDGRSIRLYTSGLGQDSLDTYASPSDVLGLDLMDFEDAYVKIRPPLESDHVINSLEVWGCRVCRRGQVAQLRFERAGDAHWRFVGAAQVPFTTPVLEEANFISRKLEEYAPQPGDDVQRIAELVDRTKP